MSSWRGEEGKAGYPFPCQTTTLGLRGTATLAAPTMAGLASAAGGSWLGLLGDWAVLPGTQVPASSHLWAHTSLGGGLAQPQGPGGKNSSANTEHPEVEEPEQKES